MSFVDDIVDAVIDAFNGAPSTWRERLQANIFLVSPEGNEFTAKWTGSPRSTPKKLGILRMPKVKGDVVQDMEVGSSLYSITFYFDGDNNDTESNAFFAACRERGTWAVTHPVHGYLDLQLISVESIDTPVEDGNITTLNTEWIEPIDPETLQTGRQAAGIIDTQIDVLNVSAAQQFANNILATSEGFKSAIEATTDGIGRVVDLFLNPLFTTVDALDVAVAAIQNGITDTYNATVLQVESLAGQIQNLIELPLWGGDSLNRRLDAYTNLSDSLTDLFPSRSARTVQDTAGRVEKRNAIATVELALASTIASIAKTIITSRISPIGVGTQRVTQANRTIPVVSTKTGVLVSKTQAIQAAIDFVETFNAIIEAAETAADVFYDAEVDKQYESFRESYADAATVVHSCVTYLLTQAFNLTVERRFTIQTPRAPIEIVVSEYGNLGKDDSFLDFFLASNDLHGKDILLLPAGKEIVLYG